MGAKALARVCIELNTNQIDLEAKLQLQNEEQNKQLEAKLQQHFQEAIKQLSEVIMSLCSSYYALHMNRLEQNCRPSWRCNYFVYDGNDDLTGKQTWTNHPKYTKCS